MGRKVNDLVGRRYSYLTVVERAAAPDGLSYRHTYWKCLCVCGRTKTISGSSLVGNLTRSCGCRKQSLRKEARARGRAGASGGKRFLRQRNAGLLNSDPWLTDRAEPPVSKAANAPAPVWTKAKDALSDLADAWKWQAT
jgi:hypothetical protein